VRRLTLASVALYNHNRATNCWPVFFTGAAFYTFTGAASRGFLMRVRTIASVSAASAIVAVLISWRAATQSAADTSPSAASNSSVGAPFIAVPTPRPVAAFSFTDGDDAPLTLADFHGRMVLLNLWATWCAPCRKEMPALDRLQAKLGGSDFTVLPVSIDHRGRDVIARFYHELGLKSLGIYVDKSANVTYAVNAVGMPTTLLVDAQGRELGRVVGPAEWDGAAMLSRLMSYLQAHDRDVGAGPHSD
jgi:thiol-disulfide isomerase/thioredoxin